MGNILRQCSNPENEDKDAAWKKQNEEHDKNPVYKLVGLDGTGMFTQKMDNEEAKDLYSRRLKKGEYLYEEEENEPHKITEEEFYDWYKIKLGDQGKKMNYEQIKKYYSSKNPFNEIKEHEACWNLKKRGGVGETAFHLAILTGKLKVASLLLELYPNMALDVYEEDEYFGESALHLAIVHNHFEMVKKLVENRAKVDQRATGQYFLPTDQKKRKSKNTNYEGDAYYGEYPLAFAACFNYQEIYDYLIEKGANPDEEDSFGNTVLHMTVIHNQPQMYKYAVQHKKKPAETGIQNKMGLTPVTLATKLGRSVMFKEILELSSTEFWSYSNVYCSAYPLTTLDSINPDGEKIHSDWSSSLMIIVNGETDDHLEMLEDGVMKQLLDEKWKTFARKRFIRQLVIALFHLVLISVAIYLRPAGTQLFGYNGTNDVIRYIAEVMVCILCAVVLCQEIKEVFSPGLKQIRKVNNLKLHSQEQIVYTISCLCILACIPCRFLHCDTAEDILLIFAVPGSWFFLLFFARSVKLVGPFVNMVYQMLLGDLLRFGVIYIIFLMGFAPGLFFLFKNRNDDNSDIQKFATVHETLMTLFQMTLGEIKYDAFNNANYAPLAKLIFAIFVVLVPILLLNMLIAMMGNTYQQIIAKSDKEWRKQWAKTIVILERGFSKTDLIKLQKEYSVRISQENEEKRALAVIKTASKTKAREGEQEPPVKSLSSASITLS